MSLCESYEAGYMSDHHLKMMIGKRAYAETRAQSLGTSFTALTGISTMHYVCVPNELNSHFSEMMSGVRKYSDVPLLEPR